MFRDVACVRADGIFDWIAGLPFVSSIAGEIALKFQEFKDSNNKDENVDHLGCFFVIFSAGRCQVRKRSALQ